MTPFNATTLLLISALLTPVSLASAEEDPAAPESAAGPSMPGDPDGGQEPATPEAPPETAPIGAEGSAEQGPPVPDADTMPAASIDAAYRQFLRLREEDRDEEATRAAFRVAELTQLQYGEDAIELATPLINLAVMQSSTGDLPAAEQNYRASIRIIERHEGMLSPRLINPLTGLGHTYNRAGMYNEAIESFDRALRLNNIELGFTNFEQFGIQDGLTESYVGLREFDDANFYQEAQLEIYQRKYGHESPQTVPAMYKLAEWYGRAGDLEQSALTYRSADRILRESEGEASPSRADALLGLARLYERQGNRPAAASTLRKAIKIIDSGEEPDRLRRAELRVALGDLYTRESRPTAARDEYKSAWADLSDDEGLLDKRDYYFDLPVRLAGGPFPKLARSAYGRVAPNLRTGSAMVRYSVDAEGHARDVVIVESNPGGMIEDDLLDTYRRSAYRPRFVDGEPAATDDLLSEHRFQYGVGTPGEPTPAESGRGKLERPDG